MPPLFIWSEKVSHCSSYCVANLLEVLHPPTNLIHADRTTVSQKHLSPNFNFLHLPLQGSGGLYYQVILGLWTCTDQVHSQGTDFIPKLSSDTVSSSHKSCPCVLHGLKQINVSYLQCDCSCKKMVVLYGNCFLLFVHHDSAQMGENGILERNSSDILALDKLTSLTPHYRIVFHHVYKYQSCNFAYEMIPSLVYPVKYPL